MNRRKFVHTLVLSPFIGQDLIAFSGDVYLSRSEFQTLNSLNHRLRKLKYYVGHANFNLLSFNSALYYARNYPKIGSFTKEELGLVDRLFHEDSSQYGFYGSKTCTDLNNRISRKDVVKIPHTGHFLFKGKPEEDYYSVLKDIGDSLILTSGVRNVVKQLSLYVNKIYRCHGNMTEATRSIAPPAFSYHTIHDFDVGKKGWGYKNFTASFEDTQEFKKMQKLHYIGMRYSKNNQDGVRFEPWHVEVI